MHEIVTTIETKSLSSFEYGLNVAETERTDYYSFNIRSINDQPCVSRDFFHFEIAADLDEETFNDFNDRPCVSRDFFHFKIAADLDEEIFNDFDDFNWAISCYTTKFNAMCINKLSYFDTLNLRLSQESVFEAEIPFETKTLHQAELGWLIYNTNEVAIVDDLYEPRCEADTNEEYEIDKNLNSFDEFGAFGDVLFGLAEVTDDALIDNLNVKVLTDNTKKDNFCSNLFWLFESLKKVRFCLTKDFFLVNINECIASCPKPINSFFEECEPEFNETICLGLKVNFCANLSFVKKVNLQATKISVIKPFTRLTVEKNISLGCSR